MLADSNISKWPDQEIHDLKILCANILQFILVVIDKTADLPIQILL